MDEDNPSPADDGAQPPAAPPPAPAQPPEPPVLAAESAVASSSPWEGPAPDAVAWVLVNWHNKHPLARRIRIQDVHTLGAVALPFLAQPLPKEPSLDGESADIAPPAPPRKRWPWQRRQPVSGPRRAWSEDFLPGLKPDAVAALALDHGFTSAPDELPLRRVDLTEHEPASGDPTQSGAFPMELVLLSAAINSGRARTRVLIGRRDKVLGKRMLDPIRLAIVGGVAVLLLALLTWALWPSSHAAEEAEKAAQAAAAASAASAAEAAKAASAAEQARAASAAEAASAASAAESAAAASEAARAASDAASAPEAVASEPASAATTGSVDLPFGARRPTSGRPSLQSGVERLEQEKAQEKAQKEKQAGEAPAGKDGKGEGKDGKSSAASAPSEAEQRLNVDDVNVGQLIKPGAATNQVVALVALPVKTKPEAEAQLAKMKEMIGQTLGGRLDSLSSGVFQTKEGWRAAVWPFGSREEAQLINATLLARGMRARAVNF